MRKQRDWTPAQREQQARKLRERKIWLVSTGPKSPEGKKTSSQNALKHGKRCGAARRLNQVFRGLDDIRRLYVSLNARPGSKNYVKPTNELIDHIGKMTRKLIAEGDILCEQLLWTIDAAIFRDKLRRNS